MAGFFSRLLGRQEPPAFDLEKAVGNLLITLPRCTAQIVVAGPEYRDKHYFCDLYVDAVRLAPWAEHHAVAVWSSSTQEQAARVALPIWLRGADVTDPTPSVVPLSFVKVLRPYIEDFVDQGIVEIFCRQCQAVTLDLSVQRLDQSREGAWSWWTDKWQCPAGHLLYLEAHELHLQLR